MPLTSDQLQELLDEANASLTTYIEDQNALSVAVQEIIDMPKPTPPPDPPTPTGGWPDATNTGVAAGITLQDHDGNLEVKQAGSTVKNMRVKRGAIVVMADDVTVQDCEVDASGGLWGIGPEGSKRGLRVTRCHVYGDGGSDRDRSHVSSGIQGAVEVSFCDVHGCENAIVQGSADFYMHDNYIHDFALWNDADDHTDGLQTYGWSGTGGLRVVHNTIIGIATCGDKTPENNAAGSSCIALSQGMHDVTIDDNYLAGGTYCLYGNAQEGGSPANTEVTNNRFSTEYRPKCGEYGTSAGFAANVTWTGNVIHETGDEVRPN